MAVTNTGAVWASIAKWEPPTPDRFTLTLATVRNGSLAEAKRFFTSEPGGTIVARPDGGIWFLPTHTSLFGVSPAGSSRSYGPFSGFLESAVANEDDSLTFTASEGVANNSNSLATLSTPGQIDLLVTDFRASGCSGDQFLTLANGPGNAVWIIDSQCGKVFLREATGTLTEADIIPSGTPPIETIDSAASAPDGSLWILGLAHARQWSLRRLTPQGVVEAYALPNPPSEGGAPSYAGPWIAGDGTPWLGVTHGCELVFAEGKALHTTSAPLANAQLTFGSGSDAWLWNDTELAQTSEETLRQGTSGCRSHMPRIRVVMPRTHISVETLEHEGITIAVSQPSVIWGAIELRTGARGAIGTRIGEAWASGRVVRLAGHRSGGLTFRFNHETLVAARRLLRSGSSVHLASTLLRAVNAQGISHYVSIESSVE